MVERISFGTITADQGQGRSHALKTAQTFGHHRFAQAATLPIAALEFGTVYGNLRLSDAERRIMDALQEKQSAAFLAAMGLFAAVTAGYRLFNSTVSVGPFVGVNTKGSIVGGGLATIEITR